MHRATPCAIIGSAVESEEDVDQVPHQDLQTVRLEMDELYREAVELAGESRAAALWSEHKLDGGSKWPGKWAKALEVVEDLREASGEG